MIGNNQYTIQKIISILPPTSPTLKYRRIYPFFGSKNHINHFAFKVLAANAEYSNCSLSSGSGKQLFIRILEEQPLNTPIIRDNRQEI